MHGPCTAWCRAAGRSQANATRWSSPCRLPRPSAAAGGRLAGWSPGTLSVHRQPFAPPSPAQPHKVVHMRVEVANANHRQRRAKKAACVPYAQFTSLRMQVRPTPYCQGCNKGAAAVVVAVCTFGLRCRCRSMPREASCGNSRILTGLHLLHAAHACPLTPSGWMSLKRCCFL